MKGGAARKDLVFLQVPEAKQGPGVKRIPPDMAPILERITSLGFGIEDPPEAKMRIASKMDEFKRSCGRSLSKMLVRSAKRYSEGFYLDNDPKGIEKERFALAVCYSMYLNRTMDSLHKRVLEMDDAGASALFETALDSVKSYLSPRHYNSSIELIISGYKGIEPLVVSSLRATGLDSEIIPLKELYPRMAKEFDDSVNALIGKMHPSW
jgi:hypothetical protein